MISDNQTHWLLSIGGVFVGGFLRHFVYDTAWDLFDSVKKLLKKEPA